MCLVTSKLRSMGERQRLQSDDHLLAKDYLSKPTLSARNEVVKTDIINTKK